MTGPTPPGVPPWPPPPEPHGDSNDRDYVEHLWLVTDNASRDADSLVAKIATAGVTASLAIAAFADKAPDTLVWGGFLFAAALIVSLLSLRLSAGAVRKYAETGRRPETVFRVIIFMDWFAVGALAIAVVLIAFAVSDVGIRTNGP